MDQMPAFIPGLELCRRYYGEVVRPILDARLPALPHAAARIGPGSEVLGYDTEVSTDHDWGPAVTLFLNDADAPLAQAVIATLGRELPPTFLGYPTHEEGADGAPHHRVAVTTVRAWARGQMAFDVDGAPDEADWLTIPSQRLLELTAGAVYHDGPGELSALRARFAYYPHDIWLYLMAAGWERIGQEEHLMSRAGSVGDELGSAVIGARLVRDVMSLALLIERRYAPYPKWFGTAFAQLACAAELGPPLLDALGATGWPERAAALGRAYGVLARMHNALGVTAPVPEATSPFFTRPFPVIWGGAVAARLSEQIADPAVRRIAARRRIGGIDQWSDSTDLRVAAELRPALRRLYED